MAETVDADHAKHDIDTIRSFLEQARSLAEWHRKRAEAFETRAGVLVGAAGVILSLTSLAVDPIGQIRGTWQIVAISLAIVASGSFLVSAIAAISALRPREYRFASREQLRKEWEAYRDRTQPPYTTMQVMGLLADQLICGGVEESPIESLAADATHRGKLIHVSIRALLVGLVCLATLGTIFAIEVAVR